MRKAVHMTVIIGRPEDMLSNDIRSLVDILRAKVVQLANSAGKESFAFYPRFPVIKELNDPDCVVEIDFYGAMARVSAEILARDIDRWKTYFRIFNVDITEV